MRLLLDLDQLFYTCPYPVKYDGDEYTFRTEYYPPRFSDHRISADIIF